MNVLQLSEAAASLLPSAATSLITGFAAKIVPTALELLAIIVPVGLSCWAIGFGVKQGIRFLQKKASSAL